MGSRLQHRKKLYFLVLAGAAGVAMTILGGFQTLHFMDSTNFCGRLCHEVMGPASSSLEEAEGKVEAMGEFYRTSYPGSCPRQTGGHLCGSSGTEGGRPAHYFPAYDGELGDAPEQHRAH